MACKTARQPWPPPWCAPPTPSRPWWRSVPAASCVPCSSQKPQWIATRWSCSPPPRCSGVRLMRPKAQRRTLRAMPCASRQRRRHRPQQPHLLQALAPHRCAPPCAPPCAHPCSALPPKPCSSTCANCAGGMWKTARCWCWTTPRGLCWPGWGRQASSARPARWMPCWRCASPAPRSSRSCTGRRLPSAASPPRRWWRIRPRRSPRPAACTSRRTTTASSRAGYRCARRWPRRSMCRPCARW